MPEMYRSSEMKRGLAFTFTMMTWFTIGPAVGIGLLATGLFAVFALEIPLKTLSDNLAKLEKYRKKPVIVVCAAGQRSAAGCRILSKAGFENVSQLEGGIQAWEKAGLPLVRGSTKG